MRHPAVTPPPGTRGGGPRRTAAIRRESNSRARSYNEQRATSNEQRYCFLNTDDCHPKRAVQAHAAKKGWGVPVRWLGNIAMPARIVPTRVQDNTPALRLYYHIIWLVGQKSRPTLAPPPDTGCGMGAAWAWHQLRVELQNGLRRATGFIPVEAGKSRWKRKRPCDDSFPARPANLPHRMAKIGDRTGNHAGAYERPI